MIVHVLFRVSTDFRIHVCDHSGGCQVSTANMPSTPHCIMELMKHNNNSGRWGGGWEGVSP